MVVILSAREFWDQETKLRLEETVSTHKDWETGVEQCITSLLTPKFNIYPDKRVLDLGCGAGRLTIPLAQRYSRSQFVGLDVSPRMLLAAYQTTSVSNVEWELGNGQDIPAHLDFDMVFSVTTLQHVSDLLMRGYLIQVFNDLPHRGQFRFQFVKGSGQQGPYAYKRSEVTVARWCDEIGFEFQELNTDPHFDEWVWMTVRKP